MRTFGTGEQRPQILSQQNKWNLTRLFKKEKCLNTMRYFFMHSTKELRQSMGQLWLTIMNSKAFMLKIAYSKITKVMIWKGKKSRSLDLTLSHCTGHFLPQERDKTNRNERTRTLCLLCTANKHPWLCCTSVSDFAINVLWALCILIMSFFPGKMLSHNEKKKSACNANNFPFLWPCANSKYFNKLIVTNLLTVNAIKQSVSVLDFL